MGAPFDDALSTFKLGKLAALEQDLKSRPYERRRG